MYICNLIEARKNPNVSVRWQKVENNSNKNKRTDELRNKVLSVYDNRKRKVISIKGWCFKRTQSSSM